MNWSPVSEAVVALHVSLFLSQIVLKSKGTLSEKPTTNLRNIHKTARTRYSSVIWTPAISIRTRATWRPWRDQLTDWNRDRRSYHLLCQLPSPVHRTIGCSKDTASIFCYSKSIRTTGFGHYEKWKRNQWKLDRSVCWFWSKKNFRMATRRSSGTNFQSKKTGSKFCTEGFGTSCFDALSY